MLLNLWEDEQISESLFFIKRNNIFNAKQMEDF